MAEYIPFAERKERKRTIRNNIVVFGLAGIVAASLWAHMVLDIKKHQREYKEREKYFSTLPVEKVPARDSCAEAMWRRLTKDIEDKKLRPTKEEFYRAIHDLNKIPYSDIEHRFPIKTHYSLPDYDGKPNP